jgi:hypothetical protein
MSSPQNGGGLIILLALALVIHLTILAWAFSLYIL